MYFSFCYVSCKIRVDSVSNFWLCTKYKFHPNRTRKSEWRHAILSTTFPNQTETILFQASIVPLFVTSIFTKKHLENITTPVQSKSIYLLMWSKYIEFYDESHSLLQSLTFAGHYFGEFKKWCIEHSSLVSDLSENNGVLDVIMKYLSYNFLANRSIVDLNASCFNCSFLEIR